MTSTTWTSTSTGQPCGSSSRARALTDDQLWHLRGWRSADEDPAVARTRDDLLLRLRASIDQALLARRERDRTLAVPHHDATSSEMSVPFSGPGATGRPPAVARPFLNGRRSTRKAHRRPSAPYCSAKSRDFVPDPTASRPVRLVA
jgi:hypothetical protein